MDNILGMLLEQYTVSEIENGECAVSIRQEDIKKVIKKLSWQNGRGVYYIMKLQFSNYHFYAFVESHQKFIFKTEWWLADGIYCNIISFSEDLMICSRIMTYLNPSNQFYEKQNNVHEIKQLLLSYAENNNLGIQRCLSFRWIKLRKAHKARKYGILGST